MRRLVDYAYNLARHRIAATAAVEIKKEAQLNIPKCQKQPRSLCAYSVKMCDT